MPLSIGIPGTEPVAQPPVPPMGSDTPPPSGRLALPTFKIGGPQARLALATAELAVATLKFPFAEAELTLTEAGIAVATVELALTTAKLAVHMTRDPVKVARGRHLLQKFRAQKLLNEQNAANGAATGYSTLFCAATGSTLTQKADSVAATGATMATSHPRHALASKNNTGAAYGCENSQLPWQSGPPFLPQLRIWSSTSKTYEKNKPYKRVLSMRPVMRRGAYYKKKGNHERVLCRPRGAKAYKEKTNKVCDTSSQPNKRETQTTTSLYLNLSSLNYQKVIEDFDITSEPHKKGFKKSDEKYQRANNYNMISNILGVESKDELNKPHVVFIIQKKPGAPATTTASKKTVKKDENSLLQRTPKNLGVGNNVQPKKDLSRMVKMPKYVRLERQRRILYQRLKVPPTISQFTKTVDKNSATDIFKIINKYRPESKDQKDERRKTTTEKGAAPAKSKDQSVKCNINQIARLVESKRTTGKKTQI